MILIFGNRSVDPNPDDKNEEENHEDTENGGEHDEEDVDGVRKLLCLDGMNHSLTWPVFDKSFYSVHTVFLLKVFLFC